MTKRDRERAVVRAAMRAHEYRNMKPVYLWTIAQQCKLNNALWKACARLAKLKGRKRGAA